MSYPFVGKSDAPTCKASFNAPCSLAVSKSIADATAAALQNASSDVSLAVTLANITAGGHNSKSGYEGFYPVVYNASGSCVAHGKEHAAVDRDISSVVLGGAGFTYALRAPALARIAAATSSEPANWAGTALAAQEDLFSRIVSAGDNAPESWIHFLGPEGIGTCEMNTESVNCPTNRVGYVSRALTSAHRVLYVLVAFTDVMAPTDSHCTTKTNGMCSVQNAVSLVGVAMSALMRAATQSALESALQSVSYGHTFHLDGGFHMWAFKTGDGGGSDECVAHGANQTYVGLNWKGILQLKGNKFVDGALLHDTFADAARQGGGWVDFVWANRAGGA